MKVGKTKHSRIYLGNVLDGLKRIPDNCVHVCVTSPPYWMQRSYLPEAHELKPLELGSESTPEEFINNQVKVFSEVKRVLRQDATLWLNIGDGFEDGCIRGLPWKLAFALQTDGWFLRSDNLWCKLCAMPSPVCGWRWTRCRIKDKDCSGCDKCQPNDGFVLCKGSWRTTVAHEYVFMFSKSPTYFCDGFPVRTAPAEATKIRDKYSRVIDDPDEQYAVVHDHETICHEGANLRSWWFITQENLKEKHYAAFPSGLPAKAIMAGTSEKGVCKTCGSPWTRVIKTKFYGYCRKGRRDKDAEEGKNEWRGTGGVEDYEAPKTIGWRPSCTCIDNTPVGSLILDPFSGSGTTGIVAIKRGNNYIGMELNPGYFEMSLRRLGEAEKNRGFAL